MHGVHGLAIAAATAILFVDDVLILAESPKDLRTGT